jgi:hypothetical protein
MPPDLLMPAFVLVLVANAVLIVLAMRSLMPARDRADPRPTPARWIDPDPDPTTRSVPAAFAPATAVAPTAATDAPAATAKKARKTATKSATRAAGVATASRAATKKSDPPPAGTAGAASTAGAAARSTRRRRFSLPPLDDDHERVNRSIESFLASGEPGPDADAAPTTVAFVALASTTEDGSMDSAVAETLERELRAAARSTDRVERVAPERWQVTLAATGELAARAYLRAVRAAMEPALDERHPPLRLVAATATVLDEAVAEAAATAERRLATALSAGSPGSSATTSEPRAAGD